MAAKPRSKRRRDKQDQVNGISAAIKGAEQPNLGTPAEKLAQPGPGLTDSPKVRQSAVSETQDDLALEDEDQAWRRAGGGGPDDPDPRR